MLNTVMVAIIMSMITPEKMLMTMTIGIIFVRNAVQWGAWLYSLGVDCAHSWVQVIWPSTISDVEFVTTKSAVIFTITSAIAMLSPVAVVVIVISTMVIIFNVSTKICVKGNSAKILHRSLFNIIWYIVILKTSIDWQLCKKYYIFHIHWKNI